MICSRRRLGQLAAGMAALPFGLAEAEAAAPWGALPKMRAKLYRFATAPFPYDGDKPDGGGPFLDVTGPGGRRGHTAPRGGVYYQDETYSDNRVLVALPEGFDLGRRAAIVVFFHGNQALLKRDVIERQRVLDQLQASSLNAALIAPQFADDALDSSAGKFWQPGAFARFMAEADLALAELWGARSARMRFAGLPVILVAFSGGYNPAAYVLSVGGLGRRIVGVVLLDALFAELDRFADWIEADHRQAFFFSAYTEAAAGENVELRRLIEAHRIRAARGLPEALVPGEVSFLETPGLDHADYVTQAWVADPLTWVFDRVQGYPRGTG